MKKIEVKQEEIQYLKKNWATLKENTQSVINEGLDFVMALVEKDLDMVVDRTNRVIVGANQWLKATRSKLHQDFLKEEEQIEKDMEVSRMDDEGGAGFINTLPHENPTETSNAAEVRH